LGNAAARFVLNDTTCSGSAASLAEIEAFLSGCPDLRNDSSCRMLRRKFGG